MEPAKKGTVWIGIKDAALVRNGIKSVQHGSQPPLDQCANRYRVCKRDTSMVACVRHGRVCESLSLPVVVHYTVAIGTMRGMIFFY